MELQSFAQFSIIYQERFMKPIWNQYPLRESDLWDALCVFLEGYAFERQGRRPDYGPAAADSIVKTKSKGEGLRSEHVREVWKDFKTNLGGKRNEANNPLSPRGTPYERKTRSRETGDILKTTHMTTAESVLEVLLGISASGLSPNIIVYAKGGIACDQLKAVHRKIQEINGIGSKIASFFLRDVATFYSVLASKDRYLLQPIDVWVRRIVKELNGPVGDPNKQDHSVDESAQKWIVNESIGVSVNAEAVNQGMWYFATQIAGSYYRLGKSIHDPTYAWKLLTQHKQALEGAARAACSL